MIALVTSNNAVAIFASVPGSFALPNGDVVNGAQVGWQSPDGTYKLVNVALFMPSAGQQISGSATYAVSNFVCTQSYSTVAVPNSTAAQTQFNAAVLSGVTLTWSVSTTLNGSYTIDPTSLILMLTEAVSLLAFSTFTNGTTSTSWPDTSGTLHTMSVAQFKAFILGVYKYVRLLQIAQIQQAAGGNPTWPSASVNITG